VNRVAPWLLVSAVCFAGFAALGWFVSSRPPAALDIAARALRGELPAVALSLTSLGYVYAITAIFVFVLALTAMTRGRVWLLAGILGWQLLSQGIVAVCKPLFHRTRPEGSLGPHLADFSYPSGHAITSIVFYAALALFVVGSRNLPKVPRAALAIALATCAAGIPWSRLALGAHYLTDVLGGLLFGLGWLVLGLALFRARPLSRPIDRSPHRAF
jgi:membrane-associated phospholipid phosphatase